MQDNDPAKSPTEPETYDLELPEDDEPSAPAVPSLDFSSDVGSSVTVDDVPEPVVPAAADIPTSAKVSEDLFKPEGDPEFVDPEVARMRREEQRKRAAEQAAIEDAQKKKKLLMIGGVLLAVAVVLVAMWKLVF